MPWSAFSGKSCCDCLVLFSIKETLFSELLLATPMWANVRIHSWGTHCLDTSVTKYPRRVHHRYDRSKKIIEINVNGKYGNWHHGRGGIWARFWKMHDLWSNNVEGLLAITQGCTACQRKGKCVTKAERGALKDATKKMWSQIQKGIGCHATELVL